MWLHTSSRKGRSWLKSLRGAGSASSSVIGWGSVGVKIIFCILLVTKVIYLQLDNTSINLYTIRLQFPQQHADSWISPCRFCFSHLCVHVSTVQIHLTSVLMDKSTNVSNVLLKDTESGRVGDHHGCQSGFVFIHLKDMWAWIIMRGQTTFTAKTGTYPQAPETPSLSWFTE